MFINPKLLNDANVLKYTVEMYYEWLRIEPDLTDYLEWPAYHLLHFGLYDY